jgi:hypothetical protein
MAEFHPTLDMSFAIGTFTFRFVPHPWFCEEPDDVFVLEGAEALIYQLQQIETGSVAALKVSKPFFRGEQIAHSVAALRPYAALPGLTLGNRICFTDATHPDLIRMYPDLNYAILMPWIAGRTWSGWMLDPAAGLSYTPEQALTLARMTAQVLWNLEAYHLAHTDIAGGNVILCPDLKSIELLDIENLYMSGAATPHYVSRGSPGYQHPRLGPQGQWVPEGDRFAGAILLTEMLAWADPVVRAHTPVGSETLFQPHELQQTDGQRWQAVRDALWVLCPPVLRLFDQVWNSATLADCPELSEWALALLEAHM